MVLDRHPELGKQLHKRWVLHQTARLRNTCQHAQRICRVLGTAEEDALKAQQPFGNGPTFMGCTHQVRHRDAHIFEKNFAEFIVTGHIAYGSYAHTRLVHVD